MGSLERERAIVRRCVAGADTIAYNDDGWDSRVYVVDGGSTVFKFARTPDVRRQYQHEIAVLRLLESLEHPVATPRVRWEGPGLEYFGYEGVVGEELSRRIAGLTAPRRKAIGTDLGNFLRQLHAESLPDAPRTDIDATVVTYRRKYRLAEPALARAFSRAEARALERFFLDELPRELHRLGGEMRLCHGDLGPWNVIVRQDGRVGVIDFGDAAYQDPSIDFSGFGDDVILDAAFAAYGADAWLLEKTALRIRAFPILDLPFYLGKQNAAGVARCIDVVRRVLVEGDDSTAVRFLRD